MSLIESAHISPDAESEAANRSDLPHELRSLTGQSHPTLDTLAANINPAPDGEVPAVDNYWRNTADIHSMHPRAVEAASINFRRNHALQESVDQMVAGHPTQLSAGSQEARNIVQTTDEWYRSLGTLNSLHNQGDRLEAASDIMLSASLAFRGADSFEELIDQPNSARTIRDVLTALDMKVDSSHDPARANMTFERIALMSDARVKASRIGRLIEDRLRADDLPPKDKADLISQRFRALRIEYGATFDYTQLLAQHAMRASDKAEVTATETVSPRFPDIVREKLQGRFPDAESLSFSEQYDILVHQDLAQLAHKAQQLIAANLAPNGDLFEIVTFLMTARQFCTSDNADIGEYIARFATWRQDSPMDGQRDAGKHSYDIELIHQVPTPDKPTWRLPIQAKAMGSGGASQSADKYDSGIIVFNLFSSVSAESGTENRQGNENYQIALGLRQLTQAIYDAEQDSLAAYAGQQWRGRATDEDRRLLVASERRLREQVARRFAQDAANLDSHS